MRVWTFPQSQAWVEVVVVVGEVEEGQGSPGLLEYPVTVLHPDHHQYHMPLIQKFLALERS